MKYLEIKSHGEMPLEAISLIGASTKRGDNNSIGMFGSGLKYAIAQIMRQEIPFVVFSGRKEIKITTEVVSFKGQSFNRILINGEPTSLTDSMGTEDWKGVFPFIREIYSNALDEDNNATIKLVTDFSKEIGYTSFYIEANADIIDLMNRFEDYFTIPKNALFKNEDYGEIYSKKSKIRIFRKGILAYEDSNMDSIFSYNLDSVEINESRVVKNIYECQNEIAKLIETCNDKRILRRWIQGLRNSNYGKFEHNCILPEWFTRYSNPAFIDVILENEYYPVELKETLDDGETKGRICLPLKLLKRFLKYAPDTDVLGLTTSEDDLDFIEKTPTTELFDKVDDAVKLLKKTNYGNRLTSTIKYCHFTSDNALGMSKDGYIWLSTKLDLYSIDEIAKIIIEEQEHFTSGYSDETRSFQNHLFNLYFNEIMKTR